MVQRLSLAMLAGAALIAGKPAVGVAADAEFADFPDVPEVVRFEETFRDAGFYVGARGGLALAQDTGFAIAGPTAIVNAYEGGYAGSAFLGFEMPDIYRGLGLRAEAEVGQRGFAVDTHTVAGVPAAAADSFGDTRAVTAMANVYIDYTVGSLRPFVGAGAGWGRLRLEDHGVTAAPGIMDRGAGGFAWQAMAGLGYDVTTTLTLEGMVRYARLGDVELLATDGTASDVDLETVEVLGGIRLAF